ncbi:hypothetical protein BDV96DRAFT_594375 [Lophiotrema nucula]|uniref:Uncharacterized protein n=1 Tax=Lophiotrema nucula TaxID=690887 RepID=A0A6A5ZQ81_9PLEO|nr:hypothetical protein BDV96DRAFT_594375 [Lophiotrema nucula]
MSTVTIINSASRAGTNLFTAIANFFCLQSDIEHIPTIVPSPPNRTRKAGPVYPRTEYRCSNNQKTSSTPRQLAKSETADETRAGFLDLPAELRNDVYTKLLVVNGPVRLTATAPSKTTKVPGLLLLRVCKQIKDEAASVFYAANSFYVQLEKELSVLSKGRLSKGRMAEDDIKHLHLPGSPPDDSCQRGCVGRVFFPAPEYHIFMTRLTIDVKVCLHWRELQERGVRQVPNKCYMDLTISAKELHQMFFEAYEKMRLLWEEKDTEWEGMLLSQDHSFYAGRILNFTISFHEAEEEEVAKSRVWMLRRKSTETAPSLDRGMHD